MPKCVVCKSEVEPGLVAEIFEYIFDQANHLGLESLTEHEQVVVEGGCCSDECFEKLD